MTFFEKLCLKDLRLSGKITLYLFIGLAFILFLIHGVMILGFQYPLDYGEGPLLNQALRITQGNPLYPYEISSPPYVITNYPPVYPVLNAFLVSIFGPHLVLGRLISLLSTIISATLIGLIVHHFYQRHGLLPGLLSASTFLIMPYVLLWSAYFRIDLLALVFSLAGLYILIKCSTKPKSIIGSAILFLLAAYTRQSFGFAGPLAGIIWVWSKNRKQALKLFTFYSAGGLAIFGILNLLTEGGFFFHIITANVNPFNWETVKHFANDIQNLMPWIMGACGLYLALGWRFTKTYLILTPYFLFAIAAATTIGKVGSNVNYLVEVSAGASIILGVVFAWLSETFSIEPGHKPKPSFFEFTILEFEDVDPSIRKKYWANLVIFLIVTIIVIAQFSGLMRRNLLSTIPSHRDRIKRGVDYIVLEEKIKTAYGTGNILADEYMAILPKNQIPLYLQPFEMTQLSAGGVWDQTPLIRSIKEQEFSLILMHHFPNYPVYLERWTPEMRESIYENYYAAHIRADTLIFIPKEADIGRYPRNRVCPDRPWKIPTDANMGMFWYNRQLLMMGDGREGEVPVFAIADGWLYQFPEWQTAVAIQHEDPLNSNQMIWSFYGDLAPAFNYDQAFIESRFIHGAGVPVKSGDLIGYQGGWLGSNQQTWNHVRFALLPAEEDGSFPEALKPIVNFQDELPAYQDLARLGYSVPISLSDYIGLPESNVFGTLVFLPYRCVSGEE